jgi:hypothetical protein
VTVFADYLGINFEVTLVMASFLRNHHQNHLQAINFSWSLMQESSLVLP